MSIPIMTPQMQNKYIPPRQSGDASTIGGLAGSALGGVIGGVAAAAGSAGTGTIAGIGAGAAVGGGIGRLIDNGNQVAGVSSQQKTPMQIPVGGSGGGGPIQRTLAASDNPQSHLEALGSSLQSLGRVNDPALKQSVGPTLMQAYTMAHQQQYGMGGQLQNNPIYQGVG